MRKLCLTSLAVLIVACGGSPDSDFTSDWSGLERPWPGADYWSNPLEDWRVSGGRLENVTAGGDRNVFLLTREISDRSGSFEVSVRLGSLEDPAELTEGFAGFRIGIRGAFDDYRDSAVRGLGLNAGVASDGRLFIGSLSDDVPKLDVSNLELTLTATPGEGGYALLLAGTDGTGQSAEVSLEDAPADWLPGGIALVSHSGPITDTPPPAQEVRETGWVGKGNSARGGTLRFWFSDWSLTGDKIDSHPERAYGPILFAMHTLDEGLMTMNVMMAPVDDSPKTVTLEVEAADEWKEVAAAEIEPASRTAQFRVENWDATRDTPYRVKWESAALEGKVRKDPVDKDEIVVAAFTGNNDLGFRMPTLWRTSGIMTRIY